jgi:D-amino-acid oxidase
MANKSVLVLGAGVSGLSVGILLLKNGYTVQIWAKDLPPNTTSNVAAAFWYPYLCNPQDKATRWSRYTLQYLEDYVIADPESGCITRVITEIFDHKAMDPWWADAVDSWRRPKIDELPKGYVDGFQVEATVMDSSRYMNWLVEQYKQLGGILEQHEIQDINEAFAKSKVVVNCTGLGSRTLFNDTELYPIRGQVVKIKSNGFKTVIADDEGPNKMAIIVPRVDDIVLGGTIQENDWNLHEDPKDTEDILNKAKALSPLFNHVEITGVTVGLRPARAEVRLEAEQIDEKTVIHNYGHGGAGYTLSWGCANDVVKLVSDLTSQ